jgi:hypothetical protein
MKMDFQWFRLALSKGPNRVLVFTWGRKHIQFRKRCVLLFSQNRTMDREQKAEILNRQNRLKSTNIKDHKISNRWLNTKINERGKKETEQKSGNKYEPLLITRNIDRRNIIKTLIHKNKNVNSLEWISSTRKCKITWNGINWKITESARQYTCM